MPPHAGIAHRVTPKELAIFYLNGIDARGPKWWSYSGSLRPGTFWVFPFWSFWARGPLQKACINVLMPNLPRTWIAVGSRRLVPPSVWDGSELKFEGSGPLNSRPNHRHGHRRGADRAARLTTPTSKTTPHKPPVLWLLPFLLKLAGELKSRMRSKRSRNASGYSFSLKMAFRRPQKEGAWLELCRCDVSSLPCCRCPNRAEILHPTTCTSPHSLCEGLRGF